jgi:ribosome-associated protein
MKEESIPESEYTITAVRSSGPGGQHVNKVSTAIVLRFDISNSTLPAQVKARLLKLSDRRITDYGVIIIKSGASRSQLRNKETVVGRLHELVRSVAKQPKRRISTKPSKGSIEKRLQDKSRRSEITVGRKKLN